MDLPCPNFFKDEKFEEGQGPSIYDLVMAEEVDILQYISWEQKPDTAERKREPVSQTLIFLFAHFRIIIIIVAFPKLKRCLI